MNTKLSNAKRYQKFLFKLSLTVAIITAFTAAVLLITGRELAFIDRDEMAVQQREEIHEVNAYIHEINNRIDWFKTDSADALNYSQDDLTALRELRRYLIIEKDHMSEDPAHVHASSERVDRLIKVYNQQADDIELVVSE